MRHIQPILAKRAMMFPCKIPCIISARYFEVAVRLKQNKFCFDRIKNRYLASESEGQCDRSKSDLLSVN